MSTSYADEEVEIMNGYMSETEEEALEATGADDLDVGSDGGGAADDELADVDESSFGVEGAPDGEAFAGLEPVAGFDESILEATPESLAEATGQERLLDVWYADLGDPAVGLLALRENLTEVVIGTDDRIRINNTTAYPWRTICSLRITAADGSNWIGTGWLVGHRTVITAGHVVYIHSRGGWVREIEVIPGRNGSSRPYGSCKSRSFRSVTGWTSSKKRSHDYGAILLPSSCKYGQQLGYFGYGSYSSGTLNNLTVNLSGYPGDKPSGTQWFHARKIKSVGSRSFSYNIDTAGGQSGSPVWRLKDGKRYAVGIHTNGSSSGNSATRIVKPVFDNIKAWKALGQS